MTSSSALLCIARLALARGFGWAAQLRGLKATSVAVAVVAWAGIGSLMAPSVCRAQTVSTLAGNSMYGYLDGAGTDARFRAAIGVAVDSDGSVYVADTDNHRIRKITSGGQVSTLAGSGSAGYTEGTGAAARFNYPYGVAVDGAGNVYVADTGNHRIRKITSGGIVSTFAGSGVAGYADGTGAAAQFASPSGVAVDGAGNVYVADYGNHRICKITSVGVVSTWAGSGTAGYAEGTGAAAQFSSPRGVVVDGAGNVYVADYGNNRIREITSAGVVSTWAGSGTAGYAEGTGAAAQFSSPQGVAVDGAGSVYVADTGNNRIRKISSAGLVSTWAGSGVFGYVDGAGATAQFYSTNGVAVDGAGNVYVADSTNNRIRKISPGLAPVFTNIPLTPTVYSADAYIATLTAIGNPLPSFSVAAGSLPAGLVLDSDTGVISGIPTTVGIFSGEFSVSNPHGTLTQGFTLTVLSPVPVFTSNPLVELLPSAHSYTARLTASGNPSPAFSVESGSLPAGLTLNGTSGVISGTPTTAGAYSGVFTMSNSAGGTTQVFSFNIGILNVRTFGGSGSAGYAEGTGGAAQFNLPIGVAMDVAGNVYVADHLNNRIRKITSAGVVSTLAGSGTSGYADGPGGAAQFKNPYGVTVDGGGNVYVADQGNHRIRKITSSGVVTTLAGSGSLGYVDGTGVAASFFFPSGMAVDGLGNVYVADASNHRIRKITSGGIVSTFAGSGVAGYADGTGAAAKFSSPYGVAVDAAGNVYVGDRNNHRIRKITSAGVVSTLAGSGTAGYAEGTGAAAQFSSPRGVAVDAAGNVYVAERSNNRIRKISSTGAVSTWAGSGIAGYAEGTGAAAQFSSPEGVAVDGAGRVYIADSGNHAIRLIQTATIPSFTSPALTSTLVTGSSTNATLVASGAPAPTFSVQSGSLPPGLVLDSTSGVISGTPETVGTFTGVFAATNSGGTATQAFSITVTQAGLAQTITFGSLDAKAYGDAPFDVSASASSGLTPSFTIVSGPATLSGSTVTLTGVGTVVVRAAQTGNATYAAATPVDQSFEVSQTAQTITFGPLAARTYVDEPFAITATASSGLAPSFTIGSGPATLSGSTITLTGVGTVVVRAAQAGSATYGAATPVDQSFVVSQAAQTITFGPLADKTYGTSPFVVSATASSGLVPSFSIVSGPATISGSTVTITGVGTVVVRSSQAGDGNYLAATSVDQGFTVLQGSQTITFGTLSNKTYGDAPFTVSATASSGLTPSYVIVSGPATISGSTVTLTGAGTVVVRAEQVGNSTYAAANAVEQNFTVAQPLTVPAFTSTALSPSLTTGTSYSAILTASGNPTPTFSVQSGTLPAGLALNVTSGVISGTPTTAGTFTGVFAATNSQDTVMQSFTFTVTLPLTVPAFTSSALSPMLPKDTSYSATLTASGNPAPTFSVQSGALPAGLTLNTTSGLISGTPTTTGTFSGVFAATNSQGTVTQVFSFTVALPQPLVSTLAGGSFNDGPGVTAKFFNPSGVAVAADGTTYVADSRHNRIRKITSEGVVTTLAGSGTAGYADGTGTAASFSGPTGVAVDAAGNVYVADLGNSRIRKITSAGVVTTLAGSGSPTFADGTGTAASFNYPRGVAVDAAGIIYVADSGNNRIRKITNAGVVTTLAGSGSTAYADGTGTTASFNYPGGVAVDAAGNLYVADNNNNRIRKITSSGVVSTLAGSTYGYAEGTGTAAKFNGPTGLVVDAAGNVYVADQYNQRIRKITSAGVVTTLAGSGTAGYAEGTGTAASFAYLNGVAVDAAGNVYVADPNNNRIRKITSAGVVSTLAGSGSFIGSAEGIGTAAKFHNPLGVAVAADGTTYVADSNNHRIRKITSAGVVSTLAGSGVAGYADGSGTAASFNYPQGVAVDSAGNLYVADVNNHRIRKITSAGLVSTLAGFGDYGFVDGIGTAARFIAPQGVAVDAAGNLYVADLGNQRIRKITSAGVVSTLAGSGSYGYAEGTGTAASFASPSGVAVDAAGNVYVADTQNNRIRKITSAGVVTTLAGSGVEGGAEGTGTAAQFHYPYGVAVDATGIVYVADLNNRIRKITSSGVVTTLAGSGSSRYDSGGFVDGIGTAAWFSEPKGVAVDAAGNVYVADTGNHAIRLITPLDRAPGFTSAAIASTLPTGSSYSTTLSARGYPIPTFSVQSGSLPAGITLNAITGEISGTSTTAGTFNGVFAATNSQGEVTQGFTFTVTPPLITAVSAGDSHSLFLKSDGTVWASGHNGWGQFGDGSTTNRSVAIKVMSGVSAIAAGDAHSLFLKIDGTVWATGHNAYGQLGDGSIMNRSTPIQVMSGVAAIAAQEGHSLFLKTDGTVWATGRNTSGELGNGTVNSVRSPVQIMAGVTSIAVGRYHSLYVKTNGTAWATGRNDRGQLGTGTRSWVYTPVQVMTDVSSVAADSHYSIFLKTDGTAWNSGNNDFGQIGNGTTVDRLTPIQVLSGVAAINAGYGHSLFLKIDGTVWMSGRNDNGQIGNGTTTSSLIPTSSISNVSAISGGYLHSLFLKTDGTAWAAGNNEFGQLGNGTTTNASNPVQVVIPAPVIEILAATNLTNTTAILNGSVNAQGDNATVSFEYGPTTAYGSSIASTPSTVTGNTFTAVSANLTGLSAGTTYYYRVNTVTSGGTYTSEGSNLVTTQASQTITFGALANKTYGDEPFVVSAAASSGLTPSYMIVSGPATISGSTVTLTGAGTVVVRASQAGNANYAAATPVDLSFTVAKAQLAVAADAKSVLAGAATPTLTATITGYVNGETSAVITGSPTIATSATAASLPGVYPISVGSGTLAAANYSFVFYNGTLSVNALSITDWQEQQFTAEQLANPAISGPTADPDHDGVPNQLEYALGGAPLVGDAGLLPVVGTRAGALTLTYTRRKDTSDLTYAVEVSSDLKTWVSGNSYTQEVTVTPIDSSRESVEVTDRTLLSAGPRRFMRLSVSQ